MLVKNTSLRPYTLGNVTILPDQTADVDASFAEGLDNPDLVVQKPAAKSKKSDQEVSE